MPAPLSKDLRKRIIEAKERGDTIARIVREKGVSESAVNKLLALYRQTGRYDPRPLNNGRKPKLSEAQLQAVTDFRLKSGAPRQFQIDRFLIRRGLR